MPTHCTSLTGAQYYIILISCLMSDVTKAVHLIVGMLTGTTCDTEEDQLQVGH